MLLIVRVLKLLYVYLYIYEVWKNIPTANKKRIVVHRPVLGPSGHFRRPNRVWHAARKKRIGQIENPLDVSRVLAQIGLLLRQPTLPAPDIGFWRLSGTSKSRSICISTPRK